MNININPNPPGGGSAPTLRYGVSHGRWPGVSGNSRSRDHQISAMFYQLAIQLGFDPLKLSSEERNLLESMANAMVPLDPLPDRAGPAPGSTTSAPNYGAYEPSWVEQIGINRREGIVKKSAGLQAGPNSSPMPFSPKINRDEPERPNQGNGSKENKVGIGDPNTPPMSDDELAGLVDSYKQANAGRGIFRPGAPPTTTPPTTAPSGGAATGAGFGMGNYTGASLAEMLQELLGGGFRGGWGRGMRA